MYSTHTQGARAKTSIPKISSTANEDQPRHVVVTIDDSECNIVTVNQEDYATITKNHTPRRTTTSEISAATQAPNSNPRRQKRSYAGIITDVRIFPDHQPHQKIPQHSEALEQDLEGTREAPWTPQQSYDVKGQPDYHMNSDGVVITSPSGHPYCSYCRIPSHPRSTCQIRAKQIAQGIDLPFCPNKGIIKSKNERKRHNKFPDNLPTANHDIAGPSKIRAENIYVNATTPNEHKRQPHFHQPRNAQKFINETDDHGIPNYWSRNGQLIVS